MDAIASRRRAASRFEGGIMQRPLNDMACTRGIRTSTSSTGVVTLAWKLFWTSLLLAFVVAHGLAFAQGNDGKPNAHGRMFGLDAPFAVEDLPKSRLRDELERLKPSSRGRAMERLHQFTFPEQDVDSIRVDDSGEPYYEDVFRSTPEAPSLDQPAQSLLQSVDPAKVFKLHSKLNASRKVYVNAQGYELRGTVWNPTARPVLYAVPFSLDRDLYSQSQAELDAIAEIWKRIADHFSPFDVDVTTERPASFGRQVGHILITREADAYGYFLASGATSCDCGGKAYIDVWGFDTFPHYQPALVFYDRLHTIAAIAAAASHELGHNLGLSHDGTIEHDGLKAQDYYEGQGWDHVSWGPIMGSAYYVDVVQWSKGEYAYANNVLDDLAIIGKRLPYRTSDHGISGTTATPLKVRAGGEVVSTTPVLDPDNLDPANKGVISNRTDVDWFSVDVPFGGTIDLAVTPAWLDSFASSWYRGASLDVRAALYDSSGALLTQNDPTSDTYARIVANVARSGRYFLTVEGVGSGDPRTNGYSDYGSVGQYFIQGTVPWTDVTIKLGAAIFNVDESAGSIRIPVTRSTATGTVSVTYATANGTAVAGSDYAPTAGTLVFADGGPTTQFITVPIIDDGVYEPDENFTLSLSGATGALIAVPGSATIWIQGSDTPTVRLGATTYNVVEGTATVTIPVIRSTSTGTASVSYATADGSARAGQDYVAKSGTLSFAAGVSVANIVISITNDTLVENAETFTVSLNNPVGAKLGNPSVATVVIDDNNDSNIRFTSAGYAVNERDGWVLVSVERVGAATLAASVNYATANGTALGALPTDAVQKDYGIVSGTLTWRAGETGVRAFTVPITNDGVYEGNETFGVTLSAAVGAALASPSTATVTILDDDVAPTISFGAATYSVLESAGSVVIPVMRSSSIGTATVVFTTEDGTPKAGADYTAKTLTLTFPAGVSTMNIPVAIINDAVSELDETFTVRLSNPTGAILGTPSVATVSIVDLDDSNIRFWTAAQSINESEGSVTITVERSGSTARPASVNYATANGTAAAGVDYVAKSGTLSWAAFEGGPKRIVIPLLNDGLYHANKTFSVTLNGVVGAAIVDPAKVTVTIIDDNPAPTIQFGSPTYSVAEGSTTVSIPVTRSTTAGTATVSYATADGTAKDASDYVAKTGTLSFGVGVSTANISISIVNDGEAEPGQTFTVGLSNPVGAVLGTPSVATVTINDNDATPLTNGYAINGIAAGMGTSKYYYIDVPGGATRLSVGTWFGSGDVDLYVRRGDSPSVTTYDCRASVEWNYEFCAIANPAPGRYFVMLYGYGAYSGVTLQATFSF